MNGRTTGVSDAALSKLETAGTRDVSPVISAHPRILMVTSVFPRWTGDATPPFVLNSAKALVTRGWRVRVLAPHSVGAARAESIDGVEVRRFSYAWPSRVQKLCYEGGMLVQLRVRPWTRALLPCFFAAQLTALILEIKRFRPDLLHSHSLLPQGLAATWVARKFRLPHVVTSHGNDVFGLKSTGLMGRMKRWVLRHANAVTVNSRATEEAVLELGADPDKIRRIPAVPNLASTDPEIVERLRRSWGQRQVVLFVGRLIEEKGVGDLITAVRRLQQAYPGLRAILVGDGADRARFEARVHEESLEDLIFFAGWVAGNEVASWMSAADVVAVPSKRGPAGWQEAQGLVAVEAMAVGTVVVASRIGGLVDMIEEGVTGFLCQPGSVESLVGALQRALERGDDKAITERALRLVDDNYSQEAVTAKTLKCYESLLS